MDVAPIGPANGRAVVFHHGGSYYGWYWEAPDRGSYPGRLPRRRKGPARVGEVVQADSAVQHEPARIQHGPAHGAPGHRRGRHRRTLHRWADGDPLRLPLCREDDATSVTINQIGLTDNRAGRGFRPFNGEIDADPDLQSAYEADVRTRHATLRAVEAGVPGAPAHPARTAAERGLAQARIRPPAERELAIDGHGGRRLAPHQGEDADPRGRNRRTGVSRQRPAGCRGLSPTARSF